LTVDAQIGPRDQETEMTANQNDQKAIAQMRRELREAQKVDWAAAIGDLDQAQAIQAEQARRQREIDRAVKASRQQ